MDWPLAQICHSTLASCTFWKSWTFLSTTLAQWHKVGFPTTLQFCVNIPWKCEPQVWIADGDCVFGSRGFSTQTKAGVAVFHAVAFFVSTALKACLTKLILFLLLVNPFIVINSSYSTTYIVTRREFKVKTIQCPLKPQLTFLSNIFAGAF